MGCIRSTTHTSTNYGINSRLGLSFPVPIIYRPAGASRNISIYMSSSAAPNVTQVVVGANDALLQYTHQPMLIPSEVDADTERRDYLLEKARQELSRTTKPTDKLKLIDMIQRLGIGFYLEDDINAILRTQFSVNVIDEEDLSATGLRFRMLRQNSFPISSDIFKRFQDQNEKFDETLTNDTLGVIELVRSIIHGEPKGEEILEEAMEFSKTRLKRSLSSLPAQIKADVGQALELPTHLRMARLEARRFIEQYATQSDHNPILLELATLDYNHVQSQHQMELVEITRWWKQLGLVDQLSFARDRPLECFLWTVGLLPEPKYSSCRIELAKTIAVLLVIDDIFDTYGKMDDLILFTDAIQRWDLGAMESLPEYMKICYMALYNLTNEICYKVLKENGWTVLPYLKSSWIDMIEGFMVEAKWFNGGCAPNLEEYVENGVSTAGSYMALVHLFFLIGEGVTEQNAQLLMKKPYPKAFSSAGRILRLWDDLGTAKEEQERGDLASSINLFMKERNLATEEEGRECILEDIYGYWKDLNGELVSQKEMPLAIIKVALNMARASQVVYKHEEDSYFSNVDNYVQALLFTPLII
uniref:Geraniol synthase n=1 Tax=Picrorhiza kurrooa TaxID=195120 RepID=A0A023UAW9_9LAMI|nr:geraniol synthase [Picrorhiza kurrooa]